MQIDPYYAELTGEQRLRVLALTYAIQFGGVPSDIVGAASLIEFYIQNGLPLPDLSTRQAELVSFPGGLADHDEEDEFDD